MKRYVDAKLVYRGRLLGHIWAEEHSKGRLDLAQRMDEDVATSDLYVVIFDVAGTPQYQRNIPHPAVELDDKKRSAARDHGPLFFTLRRGGVLFRAVYAAVWERNELAGYILVGEPLHFIGEFNRSFLLYAAPILILLIGAVYLAGNLLGRNINHSIKAFARATDHIAAKDFGERLRLEDLEKEFVPLAERFNKMCDRLGDSFELLEQFVSDASHQLRTPLAILKSNFEITLREDRPKEEYVEAIANSLEEINRLSRIVNALLQLTRAESGDAAIKKEKVNFSELICDVSDFMAPLAEVKKVSLRMSVSESVFLDGDEEWLRQFVFNLLDNSIKFCRPGDSIEIELRRENDGVAFRISDTGPGISSKHLPKIFERFYKVGDNENAQGAGIGLSICRWVANSHGGEIWVESDFEKGAIFTAKFPIV